MEITPKKYHCFSLLLTNQNSRNISCIHRVTQANKLVCSFSHTSYFLILQIFSHTYHTFLTHFLISHFSPYLSIFHTLLSPFPYTSFFLHIFLTFSHTSQFFSHFPTHLTFSHTSCFFKISHFFLTLFTFSHISQFF